MGSESRKSREVRWGDVNAIVDWLSRAMAEKEITQADLGRALGVGRDVMNKVMKGRRRLTGDELLALSRFLDIPPPETPEHSESEPVAVRPIAYVCVVGEVRAGHFEDVTYSDFETYQIPYALDPRWPVEAIQGFVIRGESINKQARDGDLAITLKVERAPRSVQNGDWVVAERRRHDLVELTVKRVRMDGDGVIELWPDSTDPRFQKPLLMGEHEGETVSVVGFVLDFMRPATRLSL